MFAMAMFSALTSTLSAQQPFSFSTPAVLTFQEGQLVDQVTPAQAFVPDEQPERLPPPPEATEQGPSVYCPLPPIKEYITTVPAAAISYPKAAINSATEAIPQYLPEGLVPAITGPTSESHRAYAVGRPLEGTSWLAASHSAGFFVGGIGGAMLIDEQLEQSIGGTFGLRFGIDYDHRWGLEKRFGFAEMNVFDVANHQRQIVNLEMGDVDLMFYPWGDTRWRPYISAGAGLSHFNYESDSGRRIDRLLIGLPFGIGVKYFWSEGVAVRAELVDNMMLGAHELSTMNNISLAAGVEFRYSGLFLRHHKG